MKEFASVRALAPVCRGDATLSRCSFSESMRLFLRLLILTCDEQFATS